jgi:hypothetical protein
VKAYESDVGYEFELEPEKGDGSLMKNPVPLFLPPPRFSPMNLMNQRKVNASFIQRCV